MEAPRVDFQALNFTFISPWLFRSCDFLSGPSCKGGLGTSGNPQVVQGQVARPPLGRGSKPEEHAQKQSLSGVWLAVNCKCHAKQVCCDGKTKFICIKIEKITLRKTITAPQVLFFTASTAIETDCQKLTPML